MTTASIIRKIEVRQAGALPAWATGKSLFEWFEIPNTALQSVEPTINPYGRPEGKITNWCGATLKRAGSVIVLGACGGHADYKGNEVDALELNVDTPAWRELHPHIENQYIYNLTAVWGDMTLGIFQRAAVHTYWGTQFDQAHNRVLWYTGGGMNATGLTPTPADWPYANNTNTPMMAFDMNTNTWLHPDTLGPLLYMGISTASMICCDPVTNIMYRVASDGSILRSYDPATNTYGTVGTIGSRSYAGSAVDPIRRRILSVGAYGGNGDPKVFDIDSGKVLAVTFGGLGTAALRLGGYPGVVWDEANECFYAFSGSYDPGSGLPPPPNDIITVHRIDPITWDVELLATSGPTPKKRANGIHNSVMYVPELRGVAFVNAYRGNVQFMRVAP